MQTTQEVLEKHGWTLECQSPLEIRHVDGSVATQRAADIVIRMIKRRDLQINHATSEMMKISETIKKRPRLRS